MTTRYLATHWGSVDQKAEWRNRTMLSRRSALAVLGSVGIGTVAFQRVLAATAEDAPVSRKMIPDAE